jgi:phage terminase small subunit
VAKTAKKDTLNPKQERFGQEYLVDHNGKQAAIRVGYSEKTAEVQASRMLTYAKVKDRVAELELAAQKRTDVTVDFVINGFVQNYNRAMQAEPVLDHEGNRTGEFKYQGQVANKALEMLGRYLKMFVDRHELTGKDGAPLLSQLTDEQLLAIATGSGARATQ